MPSERERERERERWGQRERMREKKVTGMDRENEVKRKKVR